MRSWDHSGGMKEVESHGTREHRGFAKQVKRHTCHNLQVGSYAIDRFLHFSVAAVAAFDGIGGSTQQAVIEKGQGFFHVHGEQSLQDLAQGGKALHTFS